MWKQAAALIIKKRINLGLDHHCFGFYCMFFSFFIRDGNHLLPAARLPSTLAIGAYAI